MCGSKRLCSRYSNFVIPRPPVIPEVPAAHELRHPRSTLCTQTSSSPKYPPRPNFVIPEVPSAPKLHSTMDTPEVPSASPKYPLRPNFVILRAVAESISACQRISQKSQRPLHSTMDTATSRSMTVLASPKYPQHPNFVIPEVPSAPKLRHPRSTLCAQTSSSPKYPPRPNFVIPEVPSAPKLRHSARSRRIHLRLPTHQPEKPAPSALHYGYCDFAQYDGVGIPEVPSAPKLRHPRSTLRTQTSSSPKYPPHPNFFIPEVPSAPKLRHSARSRRIHLRLPTHQPEKPAPSALHYGYCDFAQYDGVGIPEVPSAPKLRHPRSTLRAQTSSSPKYPLHPNFVILRAVAESISACQRISQKSQRPLHSTMDTATSRSMTVLAFPKYPPRPNFVIPEVPSAPKLRHPRSTLRTQTSSFCAQSQNPSPPANASARKASALCTPLWILRLRAV